VNVGMEEKPKDFESNKREEPEVEKEETRMVKMRT